MAATKRREHRAQIANVLDEYGVICTITQEASLTDALANLFDAMSKNSEPDERGKTPAIRACRVVLLGKYPPKEQWDNIIGVLGDRPDIDLLKRCRCEWSQRGYNGSSLKWLFEWYPAGGPPAQQNGNGTFNRSNRNAANRTDNERQPSPEQLAAAAEINRRRREKLQMPALQG